MDKRAEDLYRESNDRVGSFHRIQRITKSEASQAVDWLDKNMPGWDERLYIQVQAPDQYWNGVAINDEVLYEVFSPAIGLLFPNRQKKGWRPRVQVVRSPNSFWRWVVTLAAIGLALWAALKFWI